MTQRPTEPTPGFQALRRDLLWKGVLVAGIAALTLALGAGPPALPGQAQVGGRSGTFATFFRNSGAQSAWHNDLSGLPVRMADFPRVGLGALAVAPDAGLSLILMQMPRWRVDPSMKGTLDVGLDGTFAAFNARCPHLGCTTLWRSEDEARKLVPVDVGHDLIVCPCCLTAFNPYDGGRILFGPSPRPLDPLALWVGPDGDLRVRLQNYRFGQRDQV